MGVDERGAGGGSGAPPVEAGVLMDFAEPPKWPKVVGIVSIVYAGLGLVCTGCGMLSPVLTTVFVPADMEIPPSMTPSPAMWALLILSVFMVGLLLAAGILTVTRKPTGRGAHLVWAGLSVPMSIAGVALQLSQRQELIAWAKDHPDSPFAKGQDSPMGFVMIGVGLLIGLAWPTFCLIWFGLMKKNPAVGRRELVA